MRLSLSLNSFKSRRANFYPTILLFSILILAALLRFYRLDEHCLFGDEVFTLDMISGASWWEVWQNVTYGYQTQLPLYYVILHYWSILSQSTFWLRSFSLVTSLLSLFVIYKFCIYLFDKKAALLAVYLGAISPISILYSQTIRHHSLNSLFNVLSLYFFIKAVHTNAKCRWILYILASAISIYINYSSLLFLLCEGIFMLFYYKKYPLSFKRWLVSVLAILTLFFPIVFYFFRDFDSLLSRGGFSSIPLQHGFIANFLYTFFAFCLGKTVSPFNYPVVLISGITYSFIMISFFKAYFLKKISREPANFLLLVLLIVVTICAASNYNSPRYILAAGTIYGIIVSLGILKNPRKVVIALILSVSLLSFYSLYNLYTERQYHKKEMVDDWDEIAVYVKTNSRPDSPVIYNVITFAYYFKTSGCQATCFALPESDEEMPIFIKENLEPYKNSSRLIFVDSPLSGLRMERYEYEITSLNNWLRKNDFELVSKKGFDEEPWFEQKRKYINRPFPQYRTTVYIYERHK